MVFQVCAALHEFVLTRSIWRNYAVTMLDQCQPLRMEGFQRIIDLDTARLKEAVIAGTRLRDRWSTHCPQLKQPPTMVETVTEEDIIWQSPISSKHVLCCTKTGKVLCWEVHTGKRLTELDAGEDWEIWKCRIEFDERVVFFAMARRSSNKWVLFPCICGVYVDGRLDLATTRIRSVKSCLLYFQRIQLEI